MNTEIVIRAFLCELWPDGIPAGMALVLFHLDTHAHRLVHDLTEAARLLDARTFACFGCALVSTDVQGRGTTADALAIPGFWLDLDIAEGHHAERDLPTLAEAHEFIKALPISPTLILHSGGGLYLWWAFREPWTFDTPAERHQAQDLLRGWQAFILEQAAAHGWRLDDTSSLAQLLRAEGSLNSKYAPPRTVQRIGTSGPRWNPGDFEGWQARGADRRRTQSKLPGELKLWLTRAINGLNVETRVVRRNGEIYAVVLALCPVCGGVQQTRGGLATWTAHIAPLSGVLRCKRQSCEAHEWTGGGGFEPLSWVSRYLAPEVAAEVQLLKTGTEPRVQGAGQKAPNTCTLAEADAGKVAEVIDEGIVFAQSGRQIALVVVPLGAGKTRAIVERLAQHRGAYFARNHALLEEVAQLLRERGTPFTHVQGVGQACHYQEAYEYYGRRSDWRATACQKCPHSEEGSCRAWDIPDGLVILAPHSLLPTLKNRSVVDPTTGKTRRVLAGRLVVIDEGANFVETLVVSRERLRAPLNFPGAFGELSECAVQISLLVDALLTRCIMRRIQDPKRSEHPTRFTGQELLAAWSEATTELGQGQATSIVATAANMTTKKWPRPYGPHLRQRKLPAEALSHPDLRRAWQALQGAVASDDGTRKKTQEMYGQLEVVASDKEASIEIRAPWKIPLGRKSGVLVLDATGKLTLSEIEAANPETEIHEFTLNVLPRPEARIQLVHVETKSVSRRRILDRGAPTPRGIGTLRNALRTVEKLARDHCGEGSHRTGLLTFKGVADSLIRSEPLRHSVIPSGLDLTPETIGYYGKDDRGSNRYIGVRVLITFGDPVPSIGAVEADGRALGVPAQELLDQRISATLAQAHGRSRSLRADGPILHAHVGRARPPQWGACKLVGLPPGRLPSDRQDLVRSVVELLLDWGDVVAVPILCGLVNGRVLLEEGSFRTAYEALIGSFAGPPPVLPASLGRWVTQEADRLGAKSLSVSMPDARWTVWRVPTMGTPEAVVRARWWWRILQSFGLAADGEEVEWSA